MSTTERVIYTDIAPDFSRENGLDPEEAKKKIEATLRARGQAALVRLSREELQTLATNSKKTSGLLLVSCEPEQDAEVKPIYLETSPGLESYYSSGILEFLDDVIGLHRIITNNLLHIFDSTNKVKPIDVKISNRNQKNYYQVITETPDITSTVESLLINIDKVESLIDSFNPCKVLTQAKVLVTGLSNPNITIKKKSSRSPTEIAKILGQTSQ